MARRRSNGRGARRIVPCCKARIRASESTSCWKSADHSIKRSKTLSIRGGAPWMLSSRMCSAFTVDLKAQIKAAASDLGIDLCGVTTAEPPSHAAEFQKWIASGNHGEMGYMARRVERRADLRNILPG